MKAPKNFYNTVDQRKLGLEDGLLPDVTAADNGKILKVTEGKWGPGDDENTIIEANPDEQPTVDLENLKIGNTVYSVKNPELTSIKSFKLTMSNGGQYNTNKPIIEFFNEAGQEASITSSDYTVECDKTYQGNAGMDQVCSISTPDTPGTFTYTFVNDFDIEEYKLMKLTRGGTFVNDIAKNIKIELSVDGENYITIYDETTITWSDAVPYHLISLKDGSEASTLLPIVTSSDANTLLQVNSSGVWNKGVKLPVPTAGNNGQVLTVNNGDYSLKSGASTAMLRLRSQYHVSYDSTSETYNCYLNGEVNGTVINFPDGNTSLNVASGTIIDFYIKDASVIDVRGVFAVETSSVTKDSLSYYLEKAIMYDVLNDRIVRVTDVSFTSNKMYFKLTPIPAT